MKAYTDLEQSKKLAEILPVESADMAWCNNSIKGINYTDEYSANLYTVKEMQNVFNKALVGWDKYWELIPCWSLAALFEILPNKYGRGTKALYWFDDAWYCVYMDEDGDPVCGLFTDSPIDAVYKMICWLKENNKI